MRKFLTIGFVVLLLNAAYLAAFPSPTLLYVGNIILHLGLGLALAAAFAWFVTRNSEFRRRNAIAIGCFGVSLLFAIYLMWAGATRPNRPYLWVHVGAALLGTALIISYYLRRDRRLSRTLSASAAAAAIIPLGAFAFHRQFPAPEYQIRNPQRAALSMAEEGGGPHSPFWPSSAKTNVGGIIPSNFFMDSARCGECHRDIYEQWKGSMHHFASFNNQFYRKSIEYMQGIAGVQPTKWCAGCHDHAVFFNGRFEKPIEPQIDTPEAQNGLGCMSCHAIVHVGGTTGNADFTMEYPPLHELASSKNPIIERADFYLTYLNPSPHRMTFMKPFMREQPAEFCSACHKNHLDVPVNHYRFARGFNDYDNWQASGVSGEGARSFYYPAKSQTCTDCHMPLTRSNDPGNRGGFVHSHRFPAANTAVASVNKDQQQLKAEEDFLKSGFIRVDLFAASPVDKTAGQLEMRRRASDAPESSTTFAVGEEAEHSGPIVIRDVGQVAAPIDASGVTFQPGSTVRIDAVVRTIKIGHFFPAGTVDAFDVWLEVEGRDADGKLVFLSGNIEDNGRGPVEKSAHFYRSYLVDGHGNEINKRNAFAARSVLYIRLIPPGAADVAHYRIHIPKDAKGPITLSAKLNYRKFSRFFTEFAYAGKPVPGQDASRVGLDHDDQQYSFDVANIPKNVSGNIKGRIPDLPIVTLAQAEVKLPLSNAPTNWTPVARKVDRERWNDWGIGLLLQGDLKGAEYAFKKVTEADPGYADGWLNVARALIQEGETDAAKPYISRALAIDNSLGRVWFFNAMIQKSDGDYDGALSSLRRVQQQYPHDRVVLNQIGRILFLKRDYKGAVDALMGVLSVDPEDVQAHYNLMLSYRGLGDAAKAEREQKLFARFKADESAQTLTAKPRMLSPEANNERQPIHDHESSI